MSRRLKTHEFATVTIEPSAEPASQKNSTGWELSPLDMVMSSLARSSSRNLIAAVIVAVLLAMVYPLAGAPSAAAGRAPTIQSTV